MAQQLDSSERVSFKKILMANSMQVDANALILASHAVAALTNTTSASAIADLASPCYHMQNYLPKTKTWVCRQSAMAGQAPRRFAIDNYHILWSSPSKPLHSPVWHGR